METINKFKIKTKNIDYYDLKCVICQSIYINPVVLKNCGHEFCEECINEWKNHNINCPICRKEYIGHNISFSLNNIINNINVYCKNEKCESVIKYGNYKNHLKKCNYEMINCNYCEYNGFRKEHKNDICNEKLMLLIKEKDDQIIFLENIKQICISYECQLKIMEENNINFINKNKILEKTIKDNEKRIYTLNNVISEHIKKTDILDKIKKDNEILNKQIKEKNYIILTHNMFIILILFFIVFSNILIYIISFDVYCYIFYILYIPFLLAFCISNNNTNNQPNYGNYGTI